MKSQNKKILALLKAGKSITALEALNEVGCLRLAARIYDLRCIGFDIVTENITIENNKTLESKTIAKYYLRPPL